jgi:hypothetical protein
MSYLKIESLMIKKFALWLSVGILSTFAHNVSAEEVTYHPAKTVNASLEENEVTLTWEAPCPLYAGGDFDYLTGIDRKTAPSTASSGDATYTQAILLEASKWTTMENYQVTSVNFYAVAGTGRTHTIKIWQLETGTNNPGSTEPAYTKLVEITETGWQTITLTPAVNLTIENDLWIGIEIAQAAESGNIAIPYYANDGATSGKSDLRYQNSNWGKRGNNTIWPISATITRDPNAPALTAYNITLKKGDDGEPALIKTLPAATDPLEYKEKLPATDKYTYSIIAQYGEDIEAESAEAKAIDFTHETDAKFSDITAKRADNTATVSWKFTPAEIESREDETPTFTLQTKQDGTLIASVKLSTDPEDETELPTGEAYYTYEEEDGYSYEIPLTTKGDYTFTLTYNGHYSNTAAGEEAYGDDEPIVFRPLIAHITLEDKIYDATKLAITVTFDGIDEDDAPFVQGTHYGVKNANFDNTNVTTKAKKFDGNISLKGATAEKYWLDPETATFKGEASILAAPLTITGLLIPSSKEYSGSDKITIPLAGSALELVGIVGDDDITLDGKAAYTLASANAGNNINITVSGLTLKGDGATNYELNPIVGKTNITPKPLTITPTPTAADKIYDGTTTVSVSVADEPNPTYSLVGVLDADGSKVTLVPATAFAFAAAKPANDVKVNVTGWTLAGTADDTKNYKLTPPDLKANITPAVLTVTGLTADDKEYDGLRTATISAAATATLTGKIGTETVTFGGTPQGLFITERLGTHAVLVHGYTLTGANAGNYIVDPPVLTATITPRTLTLSDKASKPYDGTAAATLTTALALTGIVGTEDVSIVRDNPTATFADAKIGKDRTVTVSGLTLAGAQKDNYTLKPVLLADITPAPLTITGLTADDKTYDGKTDATASGTDTLVGIIGEEKVALDSIQYTFADANVRWVDAADEDAADAVLAAAADPTDPADPAAKVVGKVDVILTAKLTGDDAANYTLTPPALAALINPALLTITPDAGQEKLIEQLDPDTLTYTTEGWILPDTEALLTGTLTRAPGNTIGNYPILIGTLALDNTNYTLDFVDDVLFTILPAPVDGIDPVKVSGLKVYPNPVQQGSTLHIVSEVPDALIRISSITGALLQQIQATGTTTDLPITLPAGSYLLSVNGKIAKFIVR